MKPTAMEKQLLLILLFPVMFIKSATIDQTTNGTHVLRQFKFCLHKLGTSSILKSMETEEYDRLNYQWNTRLGDIKPMAILLPTTTNEISGAIMCAKELKLKVTPRSGGHSYEKYSFGNNSTLVIDLRKLDSIKVCTEHRTATVGAGTLLANLYYTVWENGKLGLPAGSCVSLGAGQTLGGGYGYMSKWWGMTLDNVLEIEVVDSSGNLRRTTAQNDKDLFWALRGGGGGNFGVVTKFKYQLYDVSTTKFTHIAFTYDILQTASVFTLWEAWNAETQYGSNYAGFVVAPVNITVNIIGHDLSDQEVCTIKKKFKKQNASVSVKHLNFIQMISDSAFPAVTKLSDLKTLRRDQVYKHPYSAKSYYSSRRLTGTVVSRLSKVLTEVPDKTFVQFSSYGGAINRVSRDATAFVHRNSLYNIQVGVNSFTNKGIEAWLNKLDAIFIQELDNGESYQNYVDGTLTKERSYLRRYYGSNLKLLMKIKKKYDPDNVFHFPQSIPTTLY